MAESTTRPIPRMRTAAGAVAEFRKLDPDTGITECYVRKVIRSGALTVVRVGNKALINFDELLALLQSGLDQPELPQETGMIRPVSEKARW